MREQTPPGTGLRFLPLLSLFTVAALALSVGSAAARARLPSVAVLDVRSTGAFDPKTVAGLSGYIATEAARYEVKVLGAADVRALIGFEREKQLLGCTDNECLASVGGALGVDFLLTTEVSEVGGVWLLSVSLLEVARVQAVARTSRKSRSSADLVDMASSAVAEVLSRFAPKPARPPEVGSAATGGGVRKAGWAVGAVGLAALAGGGVSGYLAQSSYDEAKAAVARTDEQGLARAKEDARTRMIAANVLYGVGAAALLTGVLMAVFGGPGAAPPATVAPIPGGAAVTVGGAF